MRFFENANYDFMAVRRRIYVVVAVSLLVCVAAAITFEVTSGSWLKYGVDFTGGTLVQVRMNDASSVAELRSVIDAQVPGSEITAFGEESEYLVRVPRVEGASAGETSAVIVDALRTHYGEDQFNIVRTEAVGAKVGDELQTRAALAVLLSFAATLIYLAFRFEWRFGLAAVIATGHDIALTLGLISILQLDVTLSTVAAVLTIVGYSLNDTIIVFDRVRENLVGMRRESFTSILNRSINETLPRTVLTGSTTLATLFALLIFGSGELRDFAIIMIFGIAMGTYSSIFVASPALLEIEQRWPGERVKARTRTRAGATA
ncbi:MAG: protein translocase subunit SecF [Longimicrobiales bacterium]